MTEEAILSSRKSSSVQHLSIIKRRDEWETPPKLFTQACVDYHVNPLLDVCATKSSKLCDRYFGRDHIDSAKRDALKLAWDSDFFMNPPYSMIKEFMDYAFTQVWEHHVNGLLLTYSKTDTKWWHKYIENNPLVKTHFILGRIQFLLNGQIPLTCANKRCKTFYPAFVVRCTKCGSPKFLKNASPYPSVWIVIRPPRDGKK